MLRRTLSGVSVYVVIAFEITAILVLHRLGSVRGMAIDWSHLGQWLTETRPEDAVAALVRAIALGVAYWLGATTLLYLLATLAGIPGLVRGLRPTTLPLVRRLVDGVVASSIIATSSVTGSLAAASEQPPADAVAVEHRAYTPIPAGDEYEPVYTPTPAGDPLTVHTHPATPEPTGVAITEQPQARIRQDTYVVQPGDHLWHIAEQHLAALTERARADVPVSEVDAYWRRLIAVNQQHLASGDPDVIYPGERLTLPPTTTP